MTPARLVTASLLVAAAPLGLLRLADATQTRADPPRPGSGSTVIFDVATRGHRRSPAEAARSLWSVCVATVSNAVVAGPVQGPDGWTVTLEPALGAHGRARLVGCLGDATLDDVTGRVVRVADQ